MNDKSWFCANRAFNVFKRLINEQSYEKGEHTLNQANIQDTRVALVTGGARRIGAAIVRYLHDNGFRVVLHCRTSLAEAQVLAQQLNAERADSALVVQMDLIEANAAQELIQQVFQWAGRLDVLVNNASEFIKTSCNAFDAASFDILFDANVRAPFLMSLATRPFLAKTQGVIINITDIHAKKPLKEYSLYCQTKAALEMQTRSLAREFAPEIRVNAVAPGAIMWPEEDNSVSDSVKDAIIQDTPLKTHGRPEFIAQAVLALIDNPFITGQSVNVDGGRSSF